MNHKQRAFAREYLVDLNATAAALRAGYKPATARNAANWISGERPSKPELKGLIEEMAINRARDADITVKRVLQALQEIAFGGDDVRMRDKLRSLEMCAKYLGMFNGAGHEQEPLVGPVVIDDVGLAPECEKCPHRLQTMEPVRE